MGRFVGRTHKKSEIPLDKAVRAGKVAKYSRRDAAAVGCQGMLELRSSGATILQHRAHMVLPFRRFQGRR